MSHHHPEDPTLACEVRKGNHPECTGWSNAQGGFVDWPNPDYEPPKRVQGPQRAALRAMAARTEPAGTVGSPTPTTGFAAGLEGSQRAAAAWTEHQIELVDTAIRTVAVQHRCGGEFTSDAIWNALEGAVPVTKGLTARLRVAVRAGIIDSTGKTAISERGGHHDHGQRLTVWYSLIR